MPADRMPRDIPPLWLLLALAAMIALHLGLPLGRFCDWPWTQVGWLVIALALTLMLSGLRRFQLAGTGVRPFTPVTALVVDGVYRWTRNPMYLGMLGVTVGMAICLGSISPVPVSLVLFLVLDRRFVRREEKFLRRHLGEAYDEYCRRVRRWL